MSTNDDETEVQTVLKLWKHRMERSEQAHYNACKFFSRIHYWIGIPAVITSTIVATAFFTTTESTAQPMVRFAMGLLSLFAAILASLQTFLRMAERAEKHRLAGAKFVAIKLLTQVLQFILSNNFS